MKRKNIRYTLAAMVAAVAVSGWVLPACATKKSEKLSSDTEISAGTETEEPAENHTATLAVPQAERAEYVCVTGSGVNIRSGAGGDYSALGTAEKGTLYALCGRSGNWYKTYYKNKTAYIYADYCKVVQMDKSADKQIESVIAEGCKCLGVKYVYGATRYHDGNGKRLSGFTATEFDCSSLMQYMFKLGAGINLQVNTRTQIYQGTTVTGALKRGDLMFFTNASRKNNTGVERVGHVALYLGDNYILHTASDYAKIEQISSSRWGYYLQSQRIV
ncbi:MAG: C40 family peptidase [Clostridiales bacterium]|nr:C40 family peptidase [Clostridiales bacterium]